MHNHKRNNIEVTNQHARRDIANYRFTSSLKQHHNKGSLRICPKDDINTIMHLKARKVALTIKNLHQEKRGWVMQCPGLPVVDAEETIHHLSLAIDLGEPISSGHWRRTLDHLWKQK